MSLTIRQSDAVDDAVLGVVRSELRTYNQARAARPDGYRPLVLALQDPHGTPVGGLIGRTVFDWLFVELLIVPESHRGTGLGTELMARAEAEAVSRGCHSAWLDTFEFQARGFYERLGYSCFGQLDGYPDGFARYFMRKRLRP